MAPLLHLGFILLGVPYSTQELFTTRAAARAYGPGHVAGPDSQRRSIRKKPPSAVRSEGGWRKWGRNCRSEERGERRGRGTGIANRKLKIEKCPCVRVVEFAICIFQFAINIGENVASFDRRREIEVALGCR